jgi:hypothetical protein
MCVLLLWTTRKKYPFHRDTEFVIVGVASNYDFNIKWYDKNFYV